MIYFIMMSGLVVVLALGAGRVLPDSGVIAFVSNMDGDWDIFLLDVTSGNLQPLTQNDSNDYYFLWSPDGQSIGFVSHSSDHVQTFVMNVDTGYMRSMINEDTWLTDFARSPQGDGDWSEDYVQYVFAREYDIYIRDENGQEWPLIDDNFFDDSPAFSPDGQYIAFASERDGYLEIYIMNIDGTNIRRLTDISGNSCCPTWSPNGEQIVFTTTLRESSELYLINTDGTNLKRLTWNTVDDVLPAWRP